MQNVINQFCEAQEALLAVEDEIASLQAEQARCNDTLKQAQSQLLKALKDANCLSVATCWKGNNYVLIQRPYAIEVHQLSYSDWLKPISASLLDRRKEDDLPL